jgi:hypothetical protein
MKYKDFPLELCLRNADDIIKQGLTVHQKFTCGGCGNRLTCEEPNVFYSTGKCDNCSHITTITHCNYLVTTLTPEFTRKLMKGD